MMAAGGATLAQDIFAALGATTTPKRQAMPMNTKA
jgi:hypothetical protein